METEINVWQGLFCHPFGARLFLWSVVLGELGDLDDEKSFGECTHKHLFHVQLGLVMATVTAINGVTFQKDAKTMPLAYVIGFFMHFMSMVKLSWALGAFMLDVFPGRKEVDPEYCSLWMEYIPGSTCSIEVGLGVILTGVALAAVALSFVGEVILNAHEEYGVGTAFWILIRRVKEKRFKDLGKFPLQP